jgi:hypothetical protein
LARVPLSYPTFGAVLGRVAAKIAHELNQPGTAHPASAESHVPN